MSLSNRDTDVAGPSLLALGRWVLGAPENLPISEERHQSLRDAMHGIRTILSFEDKFAMIIDNLVEFEFGLLRVSAIHSVRPFQTHGDFFGQKRDLNRHLTNLLSTTRQYLDQNHKHIEPLLGGTEVSFKKRTNDEYDGSLAYRTMELLRNYVQHRDLGVHIMTVDGSWIDIEDEEKKKLRNRTTAFLDLDHLSIGGDLSKKELGVIEDLRGCPHQPDIPLLTREYVAAVARIHKSVRKALKPTVDTWKAIVGKAIDDYSAAFPGVDVVGLSVMWRHPDRTGTKLLDVFPEPMDRLEAVQKINWCPTNLGREYVSSEYVPTKWKK
ncbi:MAG: hypothetical protein AB7L26_14455 [Hyphomonadaceae bacterium]